MANYPFFYNLLEFFPFYPSCSSSSQPIHDDHQLSRKLIFLLTQSEEMLQFQTFMARILCEISSTSSSKGWKKFKNSILKIFGVHIASNTRNSLQRCSSISIHLISVTERRWRRKTLGNVPAFFGGPEKGRFGTDKNSC